jgi:hypothetical protein
VAVVVGALSVAAIAATSGGDSVRLADPSEPAVQSADATGTGFSLFQREQTAADRVPAGAVSDGDLPYGANLALSRRVAWGDGTTVYAVPGRGVICTVVPNEYGSSVGCTSAAAILKGNGTGPGLTHSETTDQVYDVVPVTLGLESGKTVDVPVQDGGYYVEVPTSDPPRTIAYDGPNGAVSQQVPVPPALPRG